MRRYSLIVLAIVLLALGGVALFIGSHDSAMRPLGIGAILVSVYLVRISNSPSRSVPGLGGELAFKTAKSPNRLLWIVSALLVPVSIGAVIYLLNDAAHGYHETLPVYVFAGVAVVCAAVWSSLVSTLR
jgi:hypothetical protein